MNWMNIKMNSMEQKLNKQNFRIEGWFAPCIATTITGRYACCGSNWIAIEDDVTIDDVMKGWVCTAPAWKPKEEKPKVKRPTKAELGNSMIVRRRVALN